MTGARSAGALFSVGFLSSKEVAMSENVSCQLSISGSVDAPAGNELTVEIERDGQQLFLEIASPGITALQGSDLDQKARQEIQQAIHTVQKVLDSPLKLPIRHYR
jgi:hypothetical protein